MDLCRPVAIRLSGSTCAGVAEGVNKQSSVASGTINWTVAGRYTGSGNQARKSIFSLVPSHSNK
jgi:hypothetical protein